MNRDNKELVKRMKELRSMYADIGDQATVKKYDELIEKQTWKGAITPRSKFMHFDPKESWNKEKIEVMKWEPSASWNKDKSLVKQMQLVQNKLNPEAPSFVMPSRKGGKSRKHNKGSRRHKKSIRRRKN